MSVEILANKKVLIVGATGGIGAEAAKLIKNSQANVFITGRDEEKLERLASETNISSSQAFRMDITSQAETIRVAKAIHE